MTEKSRKRSSVLKSIVFFTGLALLLCLLVLWIARHSIANAVADQAIAKLANKSKNVGVELIDMKSGEIEIPSPMEARAQHLKTDFDIGVSNKDKIRSRFESENVEITAAGVFPPMVRVRLQDFSLKFHPEDVPEDFPFDGFRSGSFLSAPLPVLDPEQAIRNTLGRLETLFDENEVQADFNFSGYVDVNVGMGKSKDALLYTERLDNGKRRLRFKRDDLQKLAEAGNVRVSDEMLEILSEYPLRAPVMMVISSEAKHSAEQKKKSTPGFPDDAFRHVTWSYKLTSAFGPEFAKKVTDSHETLDGNTENERLMDFHNNAVARQLFSEGVKPSMLESIILNDERVIRSPDEVPQQKKLLK